MDDWSHALLVLSWYVGALMVLLVALLYVVVSRRHIAADVALWATLVMSVLHTANKTVRHCSGVRVYNVLPKALFRAADFATVLLTGACVVLLLTDVRRVHAIIVASVGNVLAATHLTAVYAYHFEELGW